MLGWLVGTGARQARAALQIAINVINMAVTVLLVLVSDWGIAGAALAAVIAETVGVVLGRADRVAIARRPLHAARAALFDRAKLAHMMAVNRDIMIRTAALIAAFMFFTAQGARAGDVDAGGERRAATISC